VDFYYYSNIEKGLQGSYKKKEWAPEQHIPLSQTKETVRKQTQIVGNDFNYDSKGTINKLSIFKGRTMW
jgi:hypothetical protein